MPHLEQVTCHDELLRSSSVQAFIRTAPGLRPGQENGDASEVGLIGCEGLVGHFPVQGSDRSVTEVPVQGEGTALAIDATVLHTAQREARRLCS